MFLRQKTARDGKVTYLLVNAIRDEERRPRQEVIVLGDRPDVLATLRRLSIRRAVFAAWAAAGTMDDKSAEELTRLDRDVCLLGQAVARGVGVERHED